jgi:hypothetical protein
MMWYIFYGLLLLVLGTCVWITVKKVKKDTYNPYYLKHVLVGYGFAGGLFFAASFILLLLHS